MMCFSKWTSAVLAIALLAGTASAADTVVAGKVKSVNPADKTFVMTDSANKDFTFTFGGKVVINRTGTESKDGLKAGDVINVCHDNGPRNWTAHYILVQEGTSKKFELIQGNVQSYNPATKELTFTSESAKSSTYPMGTARVRLNMEETSIDNINIGDGALIIVELVGTTPTLRNVMANRAVK